MGHEIYLCDTDCLISLYKSFTSEFKRKIKVLVRSWDLKIPEGVKREITRKTDRISKIMNEVFNHHPESVFYLKDDVLVREKFFEIERKYGLKIHVGNISFEGFWKSASGKKSADGQIVAIAQIDGYIVVSNDRAISLVCMLENVPCITWTEFARRNCFPIQQPKLF